MNAVREVRRVAEATGLTVALEAPSTMVIEGPGLRHVLGMVCLNRPRPAEITLHTDSNTLLVLNHPNSAARAEAEWKNYITLPNGGVRIILPGMALVAQEQKHKPVAPSALRLRSASGQIAESLVLQPTRRWLLRDLADDARVSLGLVHKVVSFLEREGLMEGGGANSGGKRISSPQDLLKLWAHDSQQEGYLVGKGYIYSRNIFEVVQRIQSTLSGAAIGGALAANSYTRTLSMDPTPYKIWIPESFASKEEIRKVAGLELVEDGSNFEFYAAKGDPWQVHSEAWEGIKRISKARSFVELYGSQGRLQELAEAIIGEFQ